MGKGATTRSDKRVAAFISLLTLLTAAPEKTVTRAEAAQALQTDDAGLQETIDMCALLSDSITGTRVVIAEKDGKLALAGDAGELRPLRLTLEEGLVLSHILSSVHMDAEARARIVRAALPPEAQIARDEALMGDAMHYGPHYLELTEAIESGIRCRMAYRSEADAEPAERTVDPCYLQTANGRAYLVGWDVERDGERRYRLDRISGITFTEDSVERHDLAPSTPSESIREHGQKAVLAFSSRGVAERHKWAGLGPLKPLKGAAVTAEVSYTSEEWLLDQVLAGGGQIAILSPQSLRERLCTYAANLTRDSCAKSAGSDQPGSYRSAESQPEAS